MTSDREFKPDLWDKAVEHISDVPGLSSEAQNPNELVSASRLISVLPQQKAMDRVGLPVAIYGNDGHRKLGPDGFPEVLEELPGAYTETAVVQRGELMLFHPVEFGGHQFILCVGVNAKQLHGMLPGTTLLTSSEFGVLAGILNGQSLRELAEADGVSHNTRRRQAEAALAKLGVHSQLEAVRLVYVALMDRVLQALSATHSADTGLSRLATLYGESVRFHWLHLAGGPPIRMAEFGDPRGRPVLLCHPMLFPCGVGPGGMPELRRLGLRILVPFRPGFFDAPDWQSKPNPETTLAMWSERIAALLSFLNLDRVDVASVSMSAMWAADFARRYPDRIASLVMISAPQPSKHWRGEASTASFIHSVAGIIDRAPWLANPLVRLHAKRHQDMASTLKAFRKSFKNSPEDLSDIEFLGLERLTLDVVPLTLQESTSGIVADLRVMLQPWETYLAGLETPIHFVHGSGDQVSPASVVKKLSDTLPQSRFHVADGKGHLMALRNLGQNLSMALGP